ncbi:MAG TPA: alpha-glucan family phosphorylase [Longimicrobiales bacterium]|nr:alpha-glucan family phosphorylase [Longimicrobiales bacterium]
MNPNATVNVKAALPARLAGLKRLALNLRWSWDLDTVRLWRRMDPDAWERSGHDPVRMLRGLERERLAALADDDDFLAHYDRVLADLETYLAREGTWYARRFPDMADAGAVAYFSAEYGLTECLPIYSGGLGVLSGDHLKAASDLGVPLVAVGLLYRQGYFTQRLDERGNQLEEYTEARPRDLPLAEVRVGGRALVVEVPLPGRTLRARVWRADVGRVPLLLLDTRVTGNRADDRALTDRLYGGGTEMRIAQEVLLGIGGYNALRGAGLEPRAYHMNEGHSSFLVLEHLRRLVQEDGLALAEAREAAGRALVFTTHTPVAAGHDHFPPELALQHIGHYGAALGLDDTELLAMARRPAEEATFCMTCLALRGAQQANGVSRLHGAVSRSMWHALWPERDSEQVPIGHVTNGVHLETWLAEELKELYAERFGRIWPEVAQSERFPDRLASVGDRILWGLLARQRRRLADFVEGRLRAGRAVARDGMRLDPDALTLGFARRFTPYKRATLVLRNVERMAALAWAEGRPLQLLFAGKAHPRDEGGKALLAEVGRLATEGPLAGRVVLLEGYDLELARALVQGVDVWLNTPRPPLEASGTSGMKAAANGALNVSTFDGWWAEAWREHNRAAAPIGWVIGPEDVGVDPLGGEERDDSDAAALMRLLEEQVVPAFYRRDEDGLPREWLARVRASMGQLTPFFNTGRMVGDYAERYYTPALRVPTPA